MSAVDLTPFGFTQTETTVYSTLADLGPSSGYAVAKAAQIARANAYEALHGLVAKGAAVVVDRHPVRFRAVRGEALVARIAEEAARRLEELDRQLRADAVSGADAIVPVRGYRAFVDVMMRTVAGEDGLVTCIVPADLIAATLPAWRKRAAVAAPTDLWTVGPGDAGGALEPRGSVSIERITERFGGPAVLVHTPTASVVGTIAGDASAGYWTSDPTLVSTVGSAIADLSDRR